MIKVTIAYPNSNGSSFDFDYYLATHMPMAQRLLGGALRRAEVERGFNGGAPESRAPYAAICHLYFDSADAFYAAFAPNAQALQDDIPRYTNVQPVLQLSDVVLST